MLSATLYVSCGNVFFMYFLAGYCVLATPCLCRPFCISQCYIFYIFGVIFLFLRQYSIVFFEVDFLCVSWGDDIAALKKTANSQCHPKIITKILFPINSEDKKLFDCWGEFFSLMRFRSWEEE